MSGSDAADTAGIPCMLMRGGTSKGAFFLADDLPASGRERDDLLLRIMGSPDPTQIDGVGGGHPLRSKVAVVSPSSYPGVDLEYLFLQVGVETPVVSSTQTCGNMLAGVGPFALERGLIAGGDPTTSVRIRLVNTGDVATAEFATPGGVPRYDGTAAIDGVPGTAAAVTLKVSCASPVLPTGNTRDEIAAHTVTIVDAGMPVVLMEAAAFGVTGAETPAELEGDRELCAAVETVRIAAAMRLGLPDPSTQTIPKMFLLSPPLAGGTVTTRAFIPSRVHVSIGVLMAASVAAGIRIPGAVGADLARPIVDDRIILEHPSGALTARVRTERRDGRWYASSTTLRTARKLFDGRVFPRP